jgi:hypothetical protein
MRHRIPTPTPQRRGASARQSLIPPPIKKPRPQRRKMEAIDFVRVNVERNHADTAALYARALWSAALNKSGLREKLTGKRIMSVCDHEFVNESDGIRCTRCDGRWAS